MLTTLLINLIIKCQYMYKVTTRFGCNDYFIYHQWIHCVYVCNEINLKRKEIKISYKEQRAMV